MKPRWATGLLLVAAASPALPGLAAPVVLAVALVAWLATRPPRRELGVVVAGGLVALGILLFAWLSIPAPDLEDPAWRDAALRRYAATWESLERRALEAEDALYRRGLAGEVVDRDARQAAFRALEDVDPAGGEERWARMLVDRDGEPVAWAGEGLLHELRPDEIPREGRAFEVSFGAVTLIAVEPLEEGRRPWRVLAARSLSTDTLPFAPGGDSSAASGLRWSVVPDAAMAAADATVLELEGAPSLVLTRDTLASGGSELSGASEEPIEGRPGRFAAASFLVLGLVLLTLAAMRGTGLALAAFAERHQQRGTGPGSPLAGTGPLVLDITPGQGGVARVAVLGIGGALAVARASGADLLTLGMLTTGLAVAGWGLVRIFLSSRSSRRGATRAALAGGLVALLLIGLTGLGLAAAWWPATQSFRGPGPEALQGAGTVLRVALSALAVGLLAWAVGGGPGAWVDEEGFRWRREIWAWLALPLLLAAAVAADHFGLAVPLLVAGAASIALWGSMARRGAGGLALLLLYATLFTASAWLTTSRHLDRIDQEARVQPGVEILQTQARATWAGAVNDFFTGTDLHRFVPRSPQGMEGEDLAFSLWQASPLARSQVLSRLRVTPILEGRPSEFSFGIPVDEAGEVVTDPAIWQPRLGEPLGDRLLRGSGGIEYRGRRWADVEWTLVLLPGAEADARASRDLATVEEVEAALLRGLPGGPQFGGPQFGGAQFGGVQGASPGTPRLAATGPPPLGPAAALERVGLGTLEVLTPVFLLALLALLVALPRAAFRDLLSRIWRSYSRRLLVVYTGLLLVPLLLLNGVLILAVENRLRQEQRAAGEAALATAETMVSDLLASEQRGFDLANVLDDGLLQWISQVVRHEINLYWGAEQWASSKPELFTARLLPRRIPGESYAGMAFRGREVATRTQRVGNISYLELYAPLRLGSGDALPSIFLSVPLLAQQEEVTRELDALRRQALLVTVALMILVTAVGVRLSRSFSRPLNQLVEGTRRIAAGAPSLDLAPSELELAALVAAVDDMARTIAEGRDRLMREKAVVDRMVEHITSGIVSVDPEGRVLMRNRVAEELLGVAVGDSLAEVFARHPRLEPLAEWLAGDPGALRQRTVRLVSEAAVGGRDLGDRAPEDRDTEGRATEDPDTEDPDTEDREWNLIWVPVPGDGEPTALLVVEDVTETLRGQRLEAWAEMARIIAHEIKNPLTPIRLNVEHARQVWRDQQRRMASGEAVDERFDGIFERTTDNVLTQVEELRQIASEFSTYSRIPKIEPKRGDLVEAMADLMESYTTAPPPGIEVVVEVAPELRREGLEARFDRRLLGRAVRNLVENALRASAGGGEVALRLSTVPPASEAASGEARIAITDTGSGIDPSLLQRIFDPYFSTYDTGTGLGLPIARRIAEEHGGGIAARNRTEGGLEVTITLPLAPPIDEP